MQSSLKWGETTQNSLMAITLCDSWEKDAQQFWKYAINLWPYGQGGMLKITGDGKLSTEGIGGVGDVVEFEKEEQRGKNLLSLPWYISRAEELRPFI